MSGYHVVMFHVENHGIIGRKVIDVSKITSKRVFMWEILIETYCRNE